MLAFREISQRRETIVLISNVSHGWDGIQNCQVSGAFSGNYTRLWRQAVLQLLTETLALMGKPSVAILASKKQRGASLAQLFGGPHAFQRGGLPASRMSLSFCNFKVTFFVISWLKLDYEGDL